MYGLYPFHTIDIIVVGDASLFCSRASVILSVEINMVLKY